MCIASADRRGEKKTCCPCKARVMLPRGLCPSGLQVRCRQRSPRPQGPKICLVPFRWNCCSHVHTGSFAICQVVGIAAAEIDVECKRLVRKRWPGVIELGKVENVTDEVIMSLVKSLGYAILLIAAGTPVRASRDRDPSCFSKPLQVTGCARTGFQERSHL